MMQPDEFELELELEPRTGDRDSADEPPARPSAGTDSTRFAPGSFSAELLAYTERRFTGKLVVTTASGERWFLYLHLGSLVWATGGRYPVRRWRRHVRQHCPQVNVNRLVLRKVDAPESWDYHALWLLVLRQIAPAAQVFAALQASMAEVLFDIVRAIAIAEAVPDLEVTSRRFCIAAEAGVRPSSIGMLPQQATVDLPPALERTRRQFQEWVASGLTRCSPDLVPAIADRQALQAHITPKVFQNLTALLDGQRSLRDLAAIADRDVLAIARSLAPYLRQQWVTLSKCSDLPRPLGEQVFRTPPPPPAPLRRPEQQPLIACIDDDPSVVALLEGIIAEVGYRFLDISNPIQALPMLLQHKPDLILLDLVMPIANGYELCAQIRRIEQFRKTPIAILTSNDGLVDRARAKLVGATDFLSKPVDVDKLLGLLQARCPQRD